MTLSESIREAKLAIARIKRAAPWLLVEYIEMQNAKSALNAAQARYEAAAAKWKEMGS